jgi:hypothetical protein
MQICMSLNAESLLIRKNIVMDYILSLCVYYDLYEIMSPLGQFKTLLTIVQMNEYSSSVVLTIRNNYNFPQIM